MRCAAGILGGYFVIGSLLSVICLFKIYNYEKCLDKRQCTFNFEELPKPMIFLESYTGIVILLYVYVFSVQGNYIHCNLYISRNE